MALVPLRGFTTASNWTFVFLILTIAGGRARRPVGRRGHGPVLGLEPRLLPHRALLRLSIADKHDVIAFVGLMVCGLIAARGSTRARQIAALKVTRTHRGLLNSALEQLEPGVPVGPRPQADPGRHPRRPSPRRRRGSGRRRSRSSRPRRALRRGRCPSASSSRTCCPRDARVVGRRRDPASRRGSAARPRRRPPAGGLARSVGQRRPREHGVAADPRRTWRGVAASLLRLAEAGASSLSQRGIFPTAPPTE